MFGNLSGPTLLILIAVVLIVVIGAIVWLIVWAVGRSKSTAAQHQAELQRAYEAGLHAPKE